HTKEALSIGEKYFSSIYLGGEPCIFTDLLNLLNEMRRFHENPQELLQLMDGLIKNIADIAINFQDEYDYDLQLDIAQLMQVSHQLKDFSAPSITKTDVHPEVHPGSIPSELIDSAEKIIRFSKISKEKADLFRHHLKQFKDFKTKPQKDDILSSLSASITPLFFEIYERVFKRVREENNTSKLYEMFLTYGFVDETLLYPEQIQTLYHLKLQETGDFTCPVFTTPEWLTQIKLMHRDPSINDYDLDYFDLFREMRKKGQVTDNQKKAYDQDTSGRLNFEISNMFKINHRLAYGHLQTYFPILHSGMITKDLSKALVTKEAVNKILEDILAVDFSAFHREIFYSNPKMGIEKELITKAVFPDIILMPIYGARGNMWQEISGHVRSSPGRFVLPIFTNENLEELIIKLVGNFRWELCRTMMGSSWNDVTEKSLTSEYTDYIQFYRRNKDLSDATKEKLRLQIQRYSSTRDAFTSDYKIWIKYEFNGNMRLNKVVRSILYRHCPFEKSIRTKLERQPIYNELAIPFNVARSKEAKELESRYRKLLVSSKVKDPEIEANLKFYKEQ
ncbi:MAG: hypothetical protein H7X94_12170, partial [Vallitaleaceae bacterium]|nr:hypothetical protein [Vallitaleaceae bacterium]